MLIVERLDDRQLGLVAEAEILDLAGQAVQLFLLVVVEADPRVLARRGLDVFGPDLLDQLQAAGGLLGLGLVGGEAAHEALQVGDAFLGLGVGRDLALARHGRGFHEVVVVAAIDLDRAVVEVGHVGAHLVQEVPVVRDDDHGRLALVEDVLQPADGVDVEVVGRLVEQQDVRVGEQRLHQQHAQLPARRHLAHRAVVLVGRDAGAEQQFAGARFGGVAVVFGVVMFELGGAHVVVLARIRVGVDRVALRHAGPHLGVAHHHHIEHALVFVGELVLLEVGHALARIERDVAGGRHSSTPARIFMKVVLPEPLAPIRP
jgi:hypothetical protein